MRIDGYRKVCLSVSILGLTVLSANTTVTRVHPDVPVYQIQLLGHIMLVCPETFGRSSDEIDCERWLRRTRGGNTVFVQPTLLPEEGESTIRLTLPDVVTSGDLSTAKSVLHSIRPKPRPKR